MQQLTIDDAINVFQNQAGHETAYAELQTFRATNKPNDRKLPAVTILNHISDIRSKLRLVAYKWPKLHYPTDLKFRPAIIGDIASIYTKVYGDDIDLLLKELQSLCKTLSTEVSLMSFCDAAAMALSYDVETKTHNQVKQAEMRVKLHARLSDTINEVVSS